MARKSKKLEMQRNLVMKLIHMLSPHGLQEFKEKSLI